MSTARWFLVGVALVGMGFGIEGGWSGQVWSGLSVQRAAGLLEGIGLMVALCADRMPRWLSRDAMEETG